MIWKYTPFVIYLCFTMMYVYKMKFKLTPEVVFGLSALLYFGLAMASYYKIEKMKKNQDNQIERT